MPPGSPAYTTPLSMVTPAAVRISSGGSVAMYSQRRVPSAASRPWMRPSPLRTTTTPSPMLGALSTSLDTWACHFGLPLASNASTAPLLEPTTTMPSNASTPPESLALVSICQRLRPLRASSRTIRPSLPAAKKSPSQTPGENT